MKVRRLAMEAPPKLNTHPPYYPYPLLRVLLFGSTYEKGMALFKLLAYYAILLFAIAAFYILMTQRLVLSTRSLRGKHNRQKGQSNQIRIIDSYYQLNFVTAE